MKKWTVVSLDWEQMNSKWDYLIENNKLLSKFY